MSHFDDSPTAHSSQRESLDVFIVKTRFKFSRYYVLVELLRMKKNYHIFRKILVGVVYAHSDVATPEMD